MSSKLILHNYQTKALNDCGLAFREGDRRLILSSEGGTGKTIMFIYLTRFLINKYPNERVVVFVNRNELAHQAVQSFKQYGVNAYLFMQNSVPHPRYNVIVCSVETARSKSHYPAAKYVMIDECHLASFNKVLDYYIPIGSHIIGFSATPGANESNKLYEYYQQIIETKQTWEHIRDGELCNCVHVEVPAEYQVSMDGVHKQKTDEGYDYNKKEMDILFNKPKLRKGVVELYMRYGNGEPAICFSSSVDNSQKLAEEFRMAGVNAVHVDGATEKYERKRIIDGFKSERHDVLCAVGIGTYGFDYQNLRNVIINRGVGSNNLWRQMITRGTRTCKEKGKVFFRLFDMADNLKRHGSVVDRPQYTLEPLEKKKKKDEKEKVYPVKECPKCRALVAGATRTCPKCGHEFPLQKEAEAVETNPEDFKLTFGAGLPPVPANFDALSVEEQRQFMLAVVEAQSKMVKKDGKPVRPEAVLRRLIAGVQTRQEKLAIISSFAKQKGYKHGWLQKSGILDRVGV